MRLRRSRVGVFFPFMCGFFFFVVVVCQRQYRVSGAINGHVFICPDKETHIPYVYKIYTSNNTYLIFHSHVYKKAYTMTDWESAYLCLAEKIGALERDPHMKIHSIVQMLFQDECIDWDTILVTEKKAPTWEKIAKNWKYCVVRRFTTPGRFANGGDRSSIEYKRKRPSHDMGRAPYVSMHHMTHAPKMEHLGREDYFSSPALCSDPACERFQQKVVSHRIAPHSDVLMKRRQRADVEAAIDMALQSQPRVNVYLFDDHLPVAEGADQTTLLVEDILRRFGSSRVRIWAPNLKQDIVDAHRGIAASVPVADWLTSGVGCWHMFNDRWAEAIRNAGGLDIVFADCFRGFERGCGALVADLIQRTMFRRRTDANDTRKCMLTFAVSDRYERSLGWSAAGTALQVVIDMLALYRAPNCLYTCDVLQQQAYGSTMHYFMADVKERQWVQQVHGFTPVVQHIEQ